LATAVSIPMVAAILFSLGFIPVLKNVFMAHGSVRDF
jgi:hypothetical protein